MTGIINNGGTVIIDQSIIEGATEALNSYAAEFHILNSTFNNNVTDILAHDGYFATSTVNGNHFLYAALPAYHQQLPANHILLINATGITIGGGTSEADRNTFEKKRHAISAINSDLLAYNNSFTNCGRDEPDDNTHIAHAGAAIYGESDDTHTNTITVSDNSAKLPNKFTNCYGGVETHSVHQVESCQHSLLPN